MAAPGVSMPLRFLREAFQKGVSQIRNKLESTLPRQATQSSKLQPAYAHAHHSPSSHPLQQRIKVARRWYTTAYKTILHNAAINPNPSAQNAGNHVVGAMSKMTKTTPFATTLRPRLTGGAFPRTASGYSLGNGGAAGARFFSHGPASPGEVITQVAQAMRAMAMGGKNAADEYRNYRNGGKVSVRAQLASRLAQDETAPGAYVDFHMAPTFTCLSRLSKNSISNPGFMAALDEDFTEIVNDVATVWSELQKLATLGDLPVSLAKDKEDTIRVYFAGCDREIVERLCNEVGVSRGVVGEEDRFAFELLMPTLEMKPFLESPGGSLHAIQPVPPPQGAHGTGLYWQDMLSDSSCASQDGEMTEEGTEYTPAISVDGYMFSGSSVSGLSPGQWESSEGSSGAMFPPLMPTRAEAQLASPPQHTGPVPDLGLEGLQRFLQECEEYERGGRQIWR